MVKKELVRTYKFRLYPSKIVVGAMGKTLDACRFLYNTELEYEEQVYLSKKEYVSRTELNSLILDWRVINPNLKFVYSQVLQEVTARLGKAFENFFRRVQAGGRAGFPRFKSEQVYNSFTYPQTGFKLENSNLKLSKIGSIGIRLHRKLVGKVKTLTIERMPSGKWFACFTVTKEIEIKKRDVRASVGIDLGLHSFYADSEGNTVDNPKWFRKSEEKLASLQRKKSRKKKGSNNWKKAKLKVAKAHEKIVNQRNDFLHKESRKIADLYFFVAVEKLSIRHMIKNRYLSKSVADASWSKFLNYLTYKVEETGGQIIEIEAINTSQYCICGNKVQKSLATRIHRCSRCNKEVDRDVMSAILVRRLALDYCVPLEQRELTLAEMFNGTSMKQEVSATDAQHFSAG